MLSVAHLAAPAHVVGATAADVPVMRPDIAGSVVPTLRELGTACISHLGHRLKASMVWFSVSNYWTLVSKPWSAIRK
jgi:hypothetical protein